MRNATRITVSTFGAVAGLAGLEHGIGEILQGNVPPSGLVIESWPDSAFFRILGGEPAMTIVPNLLITGILASLLALIFLVWVIGCIHRKHAGLVLILLSIALLLVGGGFGPPVLGLILGVAATRINSPRAPLFSGLRDILGKSWPWSFGACLCAWLYLFPGTTLLAYYFGVDHPALVFLAIFLAFGTLLLTIGMSLALGSPQESISRP
jgi:hypothetical protein